MVASSQGVGTLEVMTKTGKFLGEYGRRIVDDEVDLS